MDLSSYAVNWLANGERGISSNTMFTRLTGVDAMGGWTYCNHPHDPADFQRCERLLRAVPELRERLHLMAEESPEWARLVARWPEINSMLLEEIPGVYGDVPRRYGKAPRTYALMRSIIEEATP